jgi:hypothetical protein
MLIEIESYYGDRMLHGRPFQENELRKTVKELLSLVDEREFVDAFCMRFGYEPVEWSDDIKVEFTIDLDTHMVIKPKY